MPEPSPRTSGARRNSPAYERVLALLERGEPVILDGANATELERRSASGGDLRDAGDSGLWGTHALYHNPYSVTDVHRAYVGADVDVLTTDTWAILAAAELEAGGLVGQSGSTHWMDVARLGLRLARQAVDEVGKSTEIAVAFSVNGDVDTAARRQTLELLLRVLDEDPPDLLFLETMQLIRDGITFETVEAVVATGLPVWLSFRRCRHGVCGVYGQHWGGPEGDLFGRAARRFEQLGVEALLVNCLPPDHVDGMLPWLRDFVDLPLGAYPNLGHYSDAGWRFDERIGPAEYAELSAGWREQGAQIIGGCCGTTPEHIAALRPRLAGTKPGHPRSEPLAQEHTEPPVPTEPWRDNAGRLLYPIPLPEIIREPDVFVPTQGSLLAWRYLWREGIGVGAACLDVGCGSGLLTVQLALNGAERVHGIDIQRQAVANTLANAFRNGVSDRVTGEEADIYTYEPSERFDVVVASLYQMPVDPFEEYTGHRPLDYWGRNLVDHFIDLLPRLLAEDGTAYLMQLSILSQVRTDELARKAGLTTRVLDFGFFPFTAVFQRHQEQIERVEQLSDAYHLTLGGDDYNVAYLLELRRATGN